MTKRLSLSQFQTLVNGLAPELEKATIRGLRKSALYLQGRVALEISHAEPNPAFDTGELRNSVDTRFVPGGAIVSVDAPHASIIEYGRRPGKKMPPLDPIVAWVLRKRIGEAYIRTRMRSIAKQVKAVVGKQAGARAMKQNKEEARAMAARGVAFVIARAIAKNGIAPRHYFRKAWDRSVDRMVLIVNYEIAKVGWKPLPGTKKKLKALFKTGPVKGGGAS